MYSLLKTIRFYKAIACGMLVVSQNIKATT